MIDLKNILAAAALIALPVSAGAVTATPGDPMVVAVEGAETNTDLLTWISDQYSFGLFDSLLSSSVLGYGITAPSGGGYGMWLTGYAFDGAPDAPLSGLLPGQIALIFYEVTSVGPGDLFTLALREIDLRYYTSGTTYFASVASNIDGVSRTVAASISAPGPIAGAGLPAALALMGYAAWRRRQSQLA